MPPEEDLDLWDMRTSQMGVTLCQEPSNPFVTINIPGTSSSILPKENFRNWEVGGGEV